MSVRFYQSNGLPLPEPRAALQDISIRIWRPALDGFPPPEAWRPSNLAWWAFDGLGLFARRDFAELSIWKGRQMLHRLIVTPRWYRFPFMSAEDLQLGDLWTHPDARRLGLARWAVSEAVGRFGKDGRRFWYVTHADNQASIRLIESCGFTLAGTGCRTRPLGVAPLGRFRLNACDI